MRRAVISGVTGHLGQELARQLVAAGVDVHGLSRATRAHPLSELGVKLHAIDGETDSLIAAFEAIRPDTVFHLASCYRREHRSADIVPLADANFRFGTQLLEAARLASCDRFIAAGSFFQHFGSGENQALNLYAATKQGFEAVLAYYADAFGIAAASLTLYEVYGEADHRPKLMQAIADAWENAIPLRLPKEDFWLDLVHVEDAAAAFVHTAGLLESDVERAHPVTRYSVCSGRDTTPVEIMELFQRLGRRQVTVVRGEFVQPKRSMPRPWRGPVVPGWRPRVSLPDGVARIVAARRGRS